MSFYPKNECFIVKQMKLSKSLFSISKYADCAADFVYFETIFRRNTQNMQAGYVLRDAKQTLKFKPIMHNGNAAISVKISQFY